MKKLTLAFLIFSLITMVSHAQITAEFSYDPEVCGNEITVTDISTGETVTTRAWYKDDELLTGDGPETYSFSIGTINVADTVTVSLVVEGSTTSDSVAHQVICYEQPVVDAGEDFDVCGNEACLNGISGGFDGSWLPLPGAMFDDYEVDTTCVTYYGGYGVVDFTWQESNGECISQDVVSVTFWLEPNAQIAMDPEDTAVCGKVFTLHAENPGAGVDGQWISQPCTIPIYPFPSGPSITVEVTYYGYYDFWWVVSNHPDNEPPSFCSDTSEPWTVHFKAVPDVNIITDSQTVTGSSLDIEASTGLETSGYALWSSDSDDISFSDSASANTTVEYSGTPGETVTLVLEAENQCGYDSDTLLLTFAESGIDDKNNSVGIFPNPSDGKITIKTHTPVKRIDIFDITGNKTDEIIPGNNQFCVDIILQGAKGIYLVKLTTESGMYYRKVVLR